MVTRVRRQRTVLVLASLVSIAVAGCSGGGALLGTSDSGPEAGFRGGAVADEPRAALTANTILEEGGSAADAAVGLYFSLAATYPAAASLGGGGVCVVFDAVGKKAESLEFLPKSPAAGGPVAIPGNARGMAALHARYGRLNWNRLLVPAENLARFGFPTSRALAASIKAVGPDLMADRGLWRIAVNEGGRPRTEGQELRQPDLADSLAMLRLRGTIEFPPALAEKLAAGAKAAGGTVTVSEISKFAAVWRPTLAIPSGGTTIHVAPASGGIFRDIWQNLDNGEEVLAVKPPVQPVVVAAAAAKAGLQPDPGTGREAPASTAFSVTDGRGNAVACAMTMNRPFGVRQVAAGTGVVLAANPAAGPDKSVNLMPAVVVNRPVISLTRTANILYTAAAGYGDAAPAAMAQVLATLSEGKQSLAGVLLQPRAVANGTTAFFEADAGSETENALRKHGYEPKPVATLGRIDAIHCSGGLPDEPQTCQFRADPRGYGMGVAVGP